MADMLAASCQCSGSRTANISTVKIVDDAPAHLVDVLFLKAGSSTVITGGHTLQAGFDAGFVFVYFRHDMVLTYPM